MVPSSPLLLRLVALPRSSSHPSLRRAEDRAEARRRQARAHVEAADVVAVDEQHRRTNVLEMIPLLQDAHRKVDGELRLTSRLVSGGAHDGAALDAAIHSWAEVVREHLDAHR